MVSPDLPASKHLQVFVLVVCLQAIKRRSENMKKWIYIILFAGLWYLPTNKSLNQAVGGQIKQDTKNSSVIASISYQDAKGMTENDLDQTTLKNIEDWALKTWLQKSKNAYAAQGFDASTFNPSTNAKSVYMKVRGKKLGIIKLQFSQSGATVRQTTIIGIKNGQFVRVGCVCGDCEDIPVFYGECGQKVYEAFGIPMSQ
jgi:hypothetical protein